MSELRSFKFEGKTDVRISCEYEDTPTATIVLTSCTYEMCTHFHALIALPNEMSNI